ncbi:carbohydrate kinase family protein [Mucilaginibacter hurinus]|nr:carbohydrate kinase [Mucilaginibacter hurinus]
MNTAKDKPVVCFGEILWDVLPTERKPGGAPMNVAYHLHKLGIKSTLVSAIGHDKAGADLVDFLHSIKLSANYVQVSHQQPTSEVLAKISASHEVSYEIVYPVAWDNIAWDTDFEPLITNAGALVFGSLSSRDVTSRETLYKMLKLATYRVFDVNLRAPHYSVAIITDLLNQADLVKLNVSELMLIAGWYDAGCKTERDCTDMLFTYFDFKELLITKGSSGASYYTPSFRYDYPAYKINVADTIGSGDAFLAAFLAMKLKNEPLETSLDYAAAMGAFITSQSGACPDYSKFDLDRFIWEKKFSGKSRLTAALKLTAH